MGVEEGEKKSRSLQLRSKPNPFSSFTYISYDIEKDDCAGLEELRECCSISTKNEKLWA